MYHHLETRNRRFSNREIFWWMGRTRRVYGGRGLSGVERELRVHALVPLDKSGRVLNSDVVALGRVRWNKWYSKVD